LPEDTVILTSLLLNLAVALGIGLMIGAERERRKGRGPSRAPAGIRTFTIASLAGAVSLIAGNELVFAIVTAGVAALAAVSYWRTRARERDPGLTTEIALVLTTLLGGLATQQPALAAGLGVVVALLLWSRTWLHRFVRKVLTEDELEDALIFAGATLVVLPILPDRAMGPFGALNPHAIWILVILIMAIGGAGYLAVRILGTRAGLPLAGLASGFISSTATIGAMGARAVTSRHILAGAVAAAVLSTVATVVHTAAVLAATSVATLKVLAVPLIFAGAAALAYGALSTLRVLRQKSEHQVEYGHAFSIKAAVGFAIMVSTILVAAAALQQWYGGRGVLAAAALAGFVDAQSAAISVAALVASGKLMANDALFPIVAGLTTNTVSKMVVAAVAGGRAFALRVIPGLILVVAAAWAGMLISW
jgi:uncharacterized membrane protein (DUF4010 family)